MNRKGVRHEKRWWNTIRETGERLERKKGRKPKIPTLSTTDSNIEINNSSSSNSNYRVIIIIIISEEAQPRANGRPLKLTKKIVKK